MRNSVVASCNAAQGEAYTAPLRVNGLSGGDTDAHSRGGDDTHGTCASCDGRMGDRGDVGLVMRLQGGGGGGGVGVSNGDSRQLGLAASTLPLSPVRSMADRPGVGRVGVRNVIGVEG